MFPIPPESVCKTKRTSSLFNFPKSAFTFAIHRSDASGLCPSAPRFGKDGKKVKKKQKKRKKLERGLENRGE